MICWCVSVETELPGLGEEADPWRCREGQAAGWKWGRWVLVGVRGGGHGDLGCGTWEGFVSCFEGGLRPKEGPAAFKLCPGLASLKLETTEPLSRD